MALHGEANPNVPLQKGKLLEYWKTEVKMGIKFRRMYGKDLNWKRYKLMYRGFWDKKTVPVNIVYALGRSLIPQIYFRSPRVAVHPRKPGFGMHARVVERIDNYLINETGLKRQLKSLVLDNYISGIGAGILGYDSEFGFNPSFQLGEEDNSLTAFSGRGDRIEYTDNVKPGMPWFNRCNPIDFVVPWGTTCWEEARWFAFRKMRKLQDIKEDPKYKNTNRLKAPYRSSLEASSESRPEGSVTSQEENQANAWVEIYQIHDKRTQNVYVISLDHDKFLREDFDHLQIEGLPAKVLVFNEDPDYFWAPSDVRQIEHQQYELNDIRTSAKLHRRVAILKVLYDKNLIGKDELMKLLDDDVKAAVAVDTGNVGDIRKAVTILQSHVPPDLALAAREVREDVREIVGFSRNQSGAFEAPSGRRTATEADIVKAASMIRIDERRDLMADLLGEIIRYQNQLVFENWGVERVIDIVGDDGARYWVRFTGKEIKGEFAYKINPEEGVPENRQTRRQDALQFMELVSKSPGADMSYLLTQFAEQFEWLDPKLLFPSNGAGRSPERAMPFFEMVRRGVGGRATSSFPGLAR